MQNLKQYLFFIFIFLSIYSCNKEGKGGSATIEGNIVVRLINKVTSDTLTTYNAPDERVFIVYGENETFDDDTKTTYNGKFKFDYLYKGKYTIYAYSECVLHLDSCPAKINAVIETIEVTSKKETKEVATIIINKYFK